MNSFLQKKRRTIVVLKTDLWASSSRVYTSGYWVFWKYCSSTLEIVCFIRIIKNQSLAIIKISEPPTAPCWMLSLLVEPFIRWLSLLGIVITLVFILIIIFVVFSVLKIFIITVIMIITDHWYYARPWSPSWSLQHFYIMGGNLSFEGEPWFSFYIRFFSTWSTWII